MELNPGESKVASPLSTAFSPHTVSRGVDPYRGDYISYYDKWDLEPWSVGDNPNTGDYPLWKATADFLNTDASLGLGKPVHFYDRVYLNDYFGVTPKLNKNEYWGGWLNPATITAERKK